MMLQRSFRNSWRAVSAKANYASNLHCLHAKTILRPPSPPLGCLAEPQARPAQRERKRQAAAAHRAWELGGDLLRLVADAELRDVALRLVRVQRACQHADERRLARPILAQHHLSRAHTLFNYRVLNLSLPAGIRTSSEASHSRPASPGPRTHVEDIEILQPPACTHVKVIDCLFLPIPVCPAASHTDNILLLLHCAEQAHQQTWQALSYKGRFAVEFSAVK